MNTFQLECFLTVAETLNFAKTAQILNITQPAVTKNIKTLEDELNVRLFRRSTRNVELTQEGKLLITDAQVIIQTSNMAKSRFSGLSEEYRHLTIGMRLTSHIKLLTKPIKGLLEKYGSCCPQIRFSSMSQLLRMLVDEQIDIIFDVRTDDIKYEGIEYKELFKEKIYCVCTEKFPVFSYDSITVAELSSFEHIPLIFIEPPKIFKRISDMQKKIVGNRNQSMIQYSSLIEEVKLLTEVGWGMAVIPEKIISDSPNLRKIPIVDCDDISFGIYCKSRNTNEVVKSFIEIISKEFENNS